MKHNSTGAWCAAHTLVAAAVSCAWPSPAGLLCVSCWVLPHPAITSASATKMKVRNMVCLQNEYGNAHASPREGAHQGMNWERACGRARGQTRSGVFRVRKEEGAQSSTRVSWRIAPGVKMETGIRTAGIANAAGSGLMLASENTSVRQQSALIDSLPRASGQHGSDAHSLSKVHIVTVSYTHLRAHETPEHL